MEQYYFAVRVKEDIESTWNGKNKRETEVSCVVVQAWVGKEFPDMRQDEGKIEFIRVGGAVRIVGQVKGQLTLNVLRPILYPGYKEGDRDLAGHLLIR